MATDDRSTVLVQARVPRPMADHVSHDAKVLGLDGVSDVIREGLRLLRRRAPASQRVLHRRDGCPHRAVGAVPEGTRSPVGAGAVISGERVATGTRVVDLDGRLTDPGRGTCRSAYGLSISGCRCPSRRT